MLYAARNRDAHTSAEAAGIPSCDGKQKNCAGPERKVSDHEMWLALDQLCRLSRRSLGIKGLFTGVHVEKLFKLLTGIEVCLKTLFRSCDRLNLRPGPPLAAVMKRLVGIEAAEAIERAIAAHKKDRKAKQVFLHRQVLYFDGARLRHVVELPTEELARLNSKSKLLYHYAFVSPKGGRSYFFLTVTKDQKKREAELMKALFREFAGTSHLLLLPIAPIGALAKAGTFTPQEQLELYGHCSKQKMVLTVHPLLCGNYEDKMLQASTLWKSIWPFDDNFPLANRKSKAQKV